jgi:hypothetical protein
MQSPQKEEMVVCAIKVMQATEELFEVIFSVWSE